MKIAQTIGRQRGLQLDGGEARLCPWTLRQWCIQAEHDAGESGPHQGTGAREQRGPHRQRDTGEGVGLYLPRRSSTACSANDRLRRRAARSAGVDSFVPLHSPASTGQFILLHRMSLKSGLNSTCKEPAASAAGSSPYAKGVGKMSIGSQSSSANLCRKQCLST